MTTPFACIVAVCQLTGAHGVGICPGAALYPLLGFPALGEIRYFISMDRKPLVFKDDAGAWRVSCGMDFERLGGRNHLFNQHGVSK